jgi:hypothetical protein
MQVHPRSKKMEWLEKHMIEETKDAYINPAAYYYQFF